METKVSLAVGTLAVCYILIGAALMLLFIHTAEASAKNKNKVNPTTPQESVVKVKIPDTVVKIDIDASIPQSSVSPKTTWDYTTHRTDHDSHKPLKCFDLQELLQKLLAHPEHYDPEFLLRIMDSFSIGYTIVNEANGLRKLSFQTMDDVDELIRIFDTFSVEEIQNIVNIWEATRLRGGRFTGHPMIPPTQNPTAP